MRNPEGQDRIVAVDHGRHSQVRAKDTTTLDRDPLPHGLGHGGQVEHLKHAVDDVGREGVLHVGCTIFGHRTTRQQAQHALVPDMHMHVAETRDQPFARPVDPVRIRGTACVCGICDGDDPASFDNHGAVGQHAALLGHRDHGDILDHERLAGGCRGGRRRDQRGGRERDHREEGQASQHRRSPPWLQVRRFELGRS